MNETPSKRKHPRIPLAVEVRSVANPKPYNFVSKNVSLGGVYVESTQVFPIGLGVEVLIRLPYAHGEVKLRAQVVRHNQDPLTGLVNGMAIEFAPLADIEQKALTEYIKNTSSTDPTGPDLGKPSR